MKKPILIQTANNKVEVIAEIADRTASLMKGLKFRHVLSQKEGMLFVFPNEGFHAMHMKDTLIPLDLIFIDSDREIVDIKHGEKKSPDLIRPERLCRYVLEVNKDFCRHKNIKIGDKVRI